MDEEDGREEDAGLEEEGFEAEGREEDGLLVLLLPPNPPNRENPEPDGLDVCFGLDEGLGCDAGFGFDMPNREDDCLGAEGLGAGFGLGAGREGPKSVDRRERLGRGVPSSENEGRTYLTGLM